MRKIETGSYEHKEKMNEGLLATTITASGAIPITKSAEIRLNGASLAMTVATPTVLGVELWITNVAGTAATVDFTGEHVSDAGNDIFTIPAASGTVRGGIVAKSINTGTEAVPVLQWRVLPFAGVTVA